MRDQDKPAGHKLGMLKFDTAWEVLADGHAGVKIPEEIPAGIYDPDTVKLWGKLLIENAARAQQMDAVRKWLADAGVPAEQARELLTALDEATNRVQLSEAMSPLLRGLLR